MALAPASHQFSASLQPLQELQTLGSLELVDSGPPVKWDAADKPRSPQIADHLAQRMADILAPDSDPEVPESDYGLASIDGSSDCRTMWWLHGSRRIPPGSGTERRELPLVLWLEIGPDASGLAGDLGQVGPRDAQQRPRSSSWAADAHLLFADVPLGAGFSHCRGNATSIAPLRTTVAQLTADVLGVLGAATARHPRLRRAPLWVVGQVMLPVPAFLIWAWRPRERLPPTGRRGARSPR